jgi:hypothetical protein
MEAAVAALPEASRVLSSSDASQEQRAAAEAAFDVLKTAPDPLGAFRFVLEGAGDDVMLLFHTATVLKVHARATHPPTHHPPTHPPWPLHIPIELGHPRRQRGTPSRSHARAWYPRGHTCTRV